MHTLRMTLAGLALLALFVGPAKFPAKPWWSLTGAVKAFIPIWLLIAIGNMLVGIFSAGIPVLTEIPVLLVVFGVPAAIAWYLGRGSAA